MRDDILKQKLSNLMEATEDVMIDTQAEEEKSKETSDSTIQSSASAVMIAYQNANKWLDIIKESILMDMGCVFFSNYVHNLAHTMPVRFDSFGDILHTIDMKVPYPATEYIDSEPKDISESITQICGILGSIEVTLSDFIDAARSAGHKSAALSAETLMSDISLEYTSLYNIRRAFTASAGDLIKFDKWVAQYVQNQSSLLG